MVRHKPKSRPIARLGLLGDVHAEDATVAVALRLFADRGVDATVTVGDLVDGPGCADRCIELLAEAGVLAVRGNHDRWFLTGESRHMQGATMTLGGHARAFVDALPATLQVDTAAGKVLICHGAGAGAEDMASLEGQYNPLRDNLLEEEQPRVVVSGHTHRRMVWAYGGATFINAGTLFRLHHPCFATVDLVAGEVTFFDVGPRGRIHVGRAIPLVERPRRATRRAGASRCGDA
jgi:putative phosphoesterase